MKSFANDFIMFMDVLKLLGCITNMMYLRISEVIYFQGQPAEYNAIVEQISAPDIKVT